MRLGLGPIIIICCGVVVISGWLAYKRHKDIPEKLEMVRALEQEVNFLRTQPQLSPQQSFEGEINRLTAGKRQLQARLAALEVERSKSVLADLPGHLSTLAATEEIAITAIEPVQDGFGAATALAVVAQGSFLNLRSFLLTVGESAPITALTLERGSHGVLICSARLAWTP